MSLGRASVAPTRLVSSRLFVPVAILPCRASPRSGQKTVAHGASRGRIGPPLYPSPGKGERDHGMGKRRNSIFPGPPHTAGHVKPLHRRRPDGGGELKGITTPALNVPPLLNQEGSY